MTKHHLTKPHSIPNIINPILFNKVQVPHYNYVGDSILGYRSHMGAGSITSNVKSDKTLVKVHLEGEKIETGLKKFVNPSQLSALNQTNLLS